MSSDQHLGDIKLQVPSQTSRELKKGIYCANGKGHPSPLKTKNLDINKQNSSTQNHNKTDVETGDESSNLRCNKKSLSLSIANVRLRDSTQQNQIYKGGSAETQYPIENNNFDVSQYRVESLKFNKQSKQLSSQHQSTTYSSNYFKQQLMVRPNNRSHRSPIHGIQEDSTFASNLLSPNSNLENNPKVRLVSQKTPKRNNSNSESGQQIGQTDDRLILKSNPNSSPDSGQNNQKDQNRRGANSDDSPTNIYNRLTIRRRSYDQNLQNLSRVK